MLEMIQMRTHWLWDTRLSEKEVRKILKDENNPRFYIYAEKLFSRISDPQIAFEYVSEKTFCRKWPVIKMRIQKDAWAKVKVDFWQSIYKKGNQGTL